MIILFIIIIHLKGDRWYFMGAIKDRSFYVAVFQSVPWKFPLVAIWFFEFPGVTYTSVFGDVSFYVHQNLSQVQFRIISMISCLDCCNVYWALDKYIYRIIITTALYCSNLVSKLYIDMERNKIWTLRFVLWSIPLWGGSK